MSRILASAGGLTYDLPQDNLAQQAGMRTVRGGAQQSSGQNLDPLSKLMEEELYQQEGRTQEYYNKIGALQSFVKQVSSAGLDVTQPDYTNPQSIKYHTMYQQALADLYNTKNSLLRDKTLQDKAIEDPNIVQNMVNDRPVFSNVGQTARAAAFAAQGKEVKSEQELQVFRQNQEAILGQINNELAVTRDPARRAELQAEMQQIAAITPGIGISPTDLAKIEEDKRQFDVGEANKFALKKMELAADKSGKGAEKQQKTWGRVDNIIASSTNRDVTQLATIPGVADAKFEDRLGGTFLTWVDSQGYPREFKIDLRDNDSFKRSLLGMNSLFNSGQGSEGGGDVSNESIIEELNSLTDDEVTKLREYYSSQAGFAQDETQGVRDMFNEEIKVDAPAGMFEKVSTILNSVSYGYVPDSLLKKGKLAGSAWTLNEVKYSPSMTFGILGNDEVIVDLVDDKGNLKSVALDIANEKDIQILKDLVDENVDLLPADISDRVGA